MTTKKTSAKTTPRRKRKAGAERVNAQAFAGWNWPVTPTADINVRVAMWIVRDAIEQTGANLWLIKGSLVMTTPTRNSGGDPTILRINEKHKADIRLNVTVAEVAAAAGVSPAQVRTILTLAQVQAYSATIARDKAFTAFGIAIPP